MAMPSSLPSYVAMDTHSPWHISGLLSTAVESMTLPSRLKNGRESLDQLASALNVNGNQNIAKLQMSIDQKAELNGHGDRLGRSEKLEIRAQSRDTRMPSQGRNAASDNPIADRLTTFDMGFFPAESAEPGRGRKSVKEAHIFGQAETYRSDKDQENEQANDEDEDEGYDRARRRAAGLPVIHK